MRYTALLLVLLLSACATYPPFMGRTTVFRVDAAKMRKQCLVPRDNPTPWGCRYSLDRGKDCHVYIWNALPAKEQARVEAWERARCSRPD